MAKCISVTTTVELESRACPVCGILYAVSEQFWKDKYTAKGTSESTWYCPNGHSRWYAGESNEQKITRLEAEKIALQSRVASERETARKAEAAAERAKRATKAMERKAANGVCPYCQRTFAAERLQRHVHTKHPEKAHKEQP